MTSFIRHRSTGRRWLVWGVVSLLLCLAGELPLRGGELLEQRYQVSRNEYYELKNDETRRVLRHHWEPVLRALEQLLAEKPPPAADLDARIRFTLGRAYYDLYLQSFLRSDLLLAQSSFVAVVQRHSGHRLADDAWLELATIYRRLDQLDLARSALKTILTEHSAGDQIDQAQMLLREIREVEAAKAASAASDVETSRTAVAAAHDVVARQNAPTVGQSVSEDAARAREKGSLEHTLSETREVPETASTGDVNSKTSSGGSMLAKTGAARLRTVVIDPGHGGTDPGATGSSGLMEKDLMLELGLKLRKKLATANIKVVLTRTTDTFLSLEQRARIASRQNADVFLSLHANASQIVDYFGIETYYLDTASDAASEKLAARENAEPDDTSELDFILQDLLVGANVDLSRELAKNVHETMIESLRRNYTPATIKDLGVKTALFYVLYRAQVPSILLETGFITNPKEESRLKESRYQERIASAIAGAVKRYLDETQDFIRQGEP